MSNGFMGAQDTGDAGQDQNGAGASSEPTKADDGLDEKGTKAVNTTGPVIVGDHDPQQTAGCDAQAYQHQRRR